MAGLFFLTMWSLSSFAVSSSRRLAQSYSQGCYDTSEWEQKMKSFLRPRLGSHAMLFLPHSIGQRNPIASQIKESENKPLLGGSCTKLHCKDMCLQRCNKMFNHLCKQETRISRYLFWQFFPKIFIYLLLERGEGREREKERNSNVQEIHPLVASSMPQLATWPTTQACALARNGTSNHLVSWMIPKPHQSEQFWHTFPTRIIL